MSDTILDQVIENVSQLPEELQQKVLEFAQSLAESRPRGVAGQQLLRFANMIPADDLLSMQSTIESGCERVDAHEW